MSSALPTFRVIAPEFAETQDSVVEDLIDLATLQVSSDAFGNRTSEAIARLSAHYLTMQARATSMGAGAVGVGGITSARAGDLSLGFGGVGGMSQSTSSEDDALRQTTHGLAFLRIRDSRANVGFGLLT